ncbi:ATP-dependent DNA ligase [Microbacterium rhizosphaerae]|uniref:ATP-dependent DNA ligase n=1 Tax=Microbacterium rhizosphaerae TaxID=1678237 RepID=A0ABZ0SMN8_9MICO|nr:ATP-dependent DNA ligase [Microbacterium rhizosphaerae]WPR88501.1 ATP-dependent DNA ligase [Microbacterium rhizosphaerae]
MGKFNYNATTRADIDDRLLLHLQIVIGTKLRRGEAFPFTWKDDASLGGGRTTVWVSASSTLIYRYHGSRMPSVNSQWLEALMTTANSPGGLYPVNEPAAAARRDAIGPDEPLNLELVP